MNAASAPIDPDVAASEPRDRPMLVAVAAGGVIGAEARYGLGVWLPHGPAAFPWATLLINGTGCLLIGVLMAVVAAVRVHPLLRPFLGVGVLGGYTTFSTFVVDVDQLLQAGRVLPALAYLVSTAVLCVLAVTAGWALTARAMR